MVTRTQAAAARFGIFGDNYKGSKRDNYVVFTTVPITKLFAWGRGIVEDMCFKILRLRAEVCVD
jgi:hypothetical protein